MRIVIRMCTKSSCSVESDESKGINEGGSRTCFVVPAAHHEIDHLFPVERIGMSHDGQRG